MNRFANASTWTLWGMTSSLVALAFAFAGTAQACPAKGVRHHHWSPEKYATMLDGMKDELALSKSQNRRVDKLIRNAKKKNTALGEITKDNRHEKLAQKRQLRFDTEDGLHEILNCEQRESFRKLRRAHKSKRMQEKYKKWQEAKAHGHSCGRADCEGQSCPYCEKADAKHECPRCKKGKQECAACKKKRNRSE